MTVRLLAMVVFLAGACGDKPARPTSHPSTAPPPAPEAPEAPARVEPEAPAPLPAAPPETAPDVAPWRLDQVVNLQRLGALTAAQREALVRSGFFLAPQPPPPADKKNAAQVRTARLATRLFHVYERNDYIRMPSYVTADLAIDVTHAYFEAVLKRVENDEVIPKLHTALRELVAEAERVRAGAKSAGAQQEARRVVAFWSVALALLERPAKGDASNTGRTQEARLRELAALGYGDGVLPKPDPPPRLSPVPATARAMVNAAVAAAQAAGGLRTVAPLSTRVDFSQFRPRGYYADTGTLARYFRAMSWLGMAAFACEGEHADPGVIALAARTLLGAPGAARTLSRILDVTAFFAGGADAATLQRAAELLVAVKADAVQAGADALLEPVLLEAFTARLKTLPSPRVPEAGATAGIQVRVAGRRAFEDSVAMAVLLPQVERAENLRDEASIPTIMGAPGSAAVLGSARAGVLLTDAVRDRQGMEGRLGRARAITRALPETRWEGDAYHGVLDALRELLRPQPASAPALLRTEAWRDRALYAFAGGWAKLRHATILYGTQLGAECDAGDPPPPSGWVEPVPALYRKLASTSKALQSRLAKAGITGAPKDAQQYTASSFEDKTKRLVEFLDELAAISERELAGEALTRKQKSFITQVGGHAEWLLISFLDAFELTDNEQDMAIVADVFTHGPTGRAVEVALADPDLVYAIIPSPDGPVVARGAIMSYRSFLHPVSDRLTDGQWRSMVEKGEAPARPAWIRGIYAEPVRTIELPKGKHGVERCGANSGARISL